MVATLEELDEAALIWILTEPKNALTKQYRRLFDMEGAELEFREDALRAVARKAMQRKTGARGLRTILENILLDTMYDLPSMRNVAEGGGRRDGHRRRTPKPYIVYKSRRAAPRSRRRCRRGPPGGRSTVSAQRTPAASGGRVASGRQA